MSEKSEPQQPSNPQWPAGWEGHEAQQQARLANLSLAEKLVWLEESHRMVQHLQKNAGAADGLDAAGK